MAVTVVAALLAPYLAPYEPAQTDFAVGLAAPSSSHVLGTDQLGRDVLSRVLWGGRASIQAGVVATLAALVVATPIGLVAGYLGRWTDAAIMRFNDAVLAFPVLVLAIGLTAVTGPSLWNATLVIAIAQVPILVRIVRGEALNLSQEEFVEAAVANGAGVVRILHRHVFPNVANTLLVQGTIMIPFAIILEAMLSFLGLGVQPPTASWGLMLANSQQHLEDAPWLAIFPGLAIVVATLSFNLLGDGLRDALDVRDTA